MIINKTTLVNHGTAPLSFPKQQRQQRNSNYSSHHPHRTSLPHGMTSSRTHFSRNRDFYDAINLTLVRSVPESLLAQETQEVPSTTCKLVWCVARNC